MVRVDSQLAIEDGLPSTLQQQQLIKRLKDVDGGLVNGAHNGSACVDNVAYSTHDDGCCSGIQTCRVMRAVSGPHCGTGLNGKAQHMCPALASIFCMEMLNCNSPCQLLQSDASADMRFMHQHNVCCVVSDVTHL